MKNIIIITGASSGFGQLFAMELDGLFTKTWLQKKRLHYKWYKRINTKTTGKKYYNRKRSGCYKCW